MTGVLPTVAGVNLGTGTSLAFANGQNSATVNLVATKAEGPVTLAATDGTLSTSTTGGAGVSLTVASTGTQTALRITAADTTPTAGASDALTITAADQYGNTVTSYTGNKNITFSGLSTAPDGASVPTVTARTGSTGATPLGSVTSITFASGVNSSGGSLVAYKAEGPVTLAATDGTITTSGTGGTGVSLTTGQAAANAYRLSAATTTPSVGAADAISLTLVDQYQNVIAFSGDKSITFSGLGTSTNGTVPTVTSKTGAAVNQGTATTITFSNGTNSAGGSLVAYKAEGPVTLAATDSGGLATSDTGGVGVSLTATTALPHSGYRISTTDTTPTAGALNTLNIAAVDQYGNVVTGVAGTQTLTFSGPGNAPDGTIPTITDNTGAAQHIGSPVAITFTGGVSSGTGRGLIVYKAETVTLAVTDGTHASTSSGGAGVSLTASSAAQSAFRLTVASTNPVAGASDVLTIRAVDQYQNTVTSYTSSHNITFGGLGTAPNGTSIPTVTSRFGTATSLGTATSITFSSGVNSAGGTLVPCRLKVRLRSPSRTELPPRPALAGRPLP